MTKNNRTHKSAIQADNNRSTRSNKKEPIVAKKSNPAPANDDLLDEQETIVEINEPAKTKKTKAKKTEVAEESTGKRGRERKFANEDKFIITEAGQATREGSIMGTVTRAFSKAGGTKVSTALAAMIGKIEQPRGGKMAENPEKFILGYIGGAIRKGLIVAA
ncbi:hypothetical protein [Caudoviricetes sp.]|nr:hypothetical protein [Caudoviricetes sp.]